MKKILVLLIALTAIHITSQAALVFSLDSYNSSTGAFDIRISGQVDSVSTWYSWSNDQLYIIDPGVDWVFANVGSNSGGSDITPHITPHNTRDSTGSYSVSTTTFFTSDTSEDHISLTFDNDFSVGENVDFTWSYSISPSRADLSLLTAGTQVVAGAQDVVPEPATALSLLIGGGLLAAFRRRFSA